MTDAPATPSLPPHPRIDAQARTHDQIMANRRRLRALADRLPRPKVHQRGNSARHALSGRHSEESAT